MTDNQKEKIKRLRVQGYGYKAIAAEIAVSRDTVKSYCRRNNLIDVEIIQTEDCCKECGKSIEQQKKMKKKIFCSRSCREKWWSEHLDKINRKAIYSFVCRNCGKAFTAYGNSKRVYCSHECYIKKRFGGGDDEQ